MRHAPTTGGDTVTGLLESVTTGASPDDILSGLDRVGIEWHLTEQGDLMIRYWQVAAEGLVPPERAAMIRMGRQAPGDANALEWVSKHLDELRAQHPGRWIAVVGGEVIGSAAGLAELLQQVQAAGVEQPFVTQIPAAPGTWLTTYGG